MDLIAILLVGLLGSVHCVGMCGGFVLALSQGQHRRRAQVRQVFYFLGKTLTYTVLGAIAGLLGYMVSGVMVGMQQALSIALGVLLILIGLGLLGVLRRFAGLRLTQPLFRLVSTMGSLLRGRSMQAAVGLGVVNGLLPCGLVYGMLMLAASTGSPLFGALTMAVFGLATIPALFAVGLAGTLIQPAWRARLSRLGGILVIVLGLITILRGTPLLDAVMHRLHSTSTSGQHEQTNHDHSHTPE